MKNREEVVKEMQAVVEQMRLDDIEENPDCENEFFTCAACGDTNLLQALFITDKTTDSATTVCFLPKSDLNSGRLKTLKNLLTQWKTKGWKLTANF